MTTEKNTAQDSIVIPRNIEQLKDIPTVQELRKKYKVRVVHRRVYENFPVPVTKEQASGINMIFDIGAVYPRGGSTEIFIQENGKTKRGVSFCSINDNFNRRLGVKYAIFRALNNV